MTNPGGLAATQLGDFKLLRKLGEGAAGVVYHARQLSFERDAAVKVLFKTSPKQIERLYREARLAGRLDHPNIVQGYAVDEDHGYHFFAMEYVDGQSLQVWLDHLRRLRVGDALYIALAIARALEYAHGQNLVHRDIKPGNILLSRKGEVKLVDLGLAKIRDVDLAELTRTGRGMGTPCYMPMEQFVNAKEVDGRCDIYALGCMLHAMLTGQPPFTSPSFLELIQAKEAGTFRPAREVNPEVPERLDEIVARMTAKRLENRYQSCTEVIKALESLGLAGARLRMKPPQVEAARSDQVQPAVAPSAPALRSEPAAPAATPAPPARPGVRKDTSAAISPAPRREPAPASVPAPSAPPTRPRGNWKSPAPAPPVSISRRPLLWIAIGIGIGIFLALCILHFF